MYVEGPAIETDELEMHLVHAWRPREQSAAIVAVPGDLRRFAKARSGAIESRHGGFECPLLRFGRLPCPHCGVS